MSVCNVEGGAHSKKSQRLQIKTQMFPSYVGGDQMQS